MEFSLLNIKYVFCFRFPSKKVNIKIYKTIILSVIFRGCKTLSVTRKEEQRLKSSENRVLRRIFGPKRKEVTRGWRNLHNEKLHNFFASQSIVSVSNQGE